MRNILLIRYTFLSFPVTSLEAVVVQLQDSCRESRSEIQDLRQENGRLTNSLETLRHESREREKYLRALWHARKNTSHDPGLDDFPPPPASFQMAESQSNTTAPNSLAGTPIQTHTNPVPYPTPAHPGHQPAENMDPRVQYQSHDSSGPMQSATAYHDGHGAPYPNRSPSLPFVNSDGEAINANGRPLDPRMQKIGQYPAVFNMPPGASRDNNTWTNANQGGNSTASPVTGAHENGSTVHSPAYMPSPHATANELAYPPRYGALDAQQKSSLDSVPYILSTSERSISPVVSSPHNSSSTSVNSQFQFVFPSESPERGGGEVDYQRRYAPPAPEMTLHGGTADVSSYASAFNINRQHSNTGPERPMLGAPAPPRTNDPPQPQQVVNSSPSTSKDTGPSDVRTTRRSRRLSEQAGSTSQTPSRSPSPTGHHPISSTLAVIKAQAFGALRRTRARPKKTEHASKVAMEVLEARGIGIGLGLTTGSSNKRPRLHDSESM